MAPMTPFTPEELYADFAANLMAADVLDMDPDDLVEHCEGELVEGAASDGYPVNDNGTIDFVTIAGIVRSQAEAVDAAGKTPTHTRQKTAYTVLVYIGKSATHTSDERMAAWRRAADADGMTLGRWLAMLADDKAGVE